MKINFYKITAAALLFVSPALLGQGNIQDYKNIMDNPLYEASYLYGNFEREKAIQLLVSLYNNPLYKNSAYINSGQIMDNEKNAALAEKYYNIAYQAGDKTAFIYLHNLYKTYNTGRFLQMLQSAGVPESNYWPDYETALYYLKNNDFKTGLQCLRNALKKGFNSTVLLQNEPLFDPVRESTLFKRLAEITQYNSTKKTSILKKLLLTEYLKNQDRPCGISKELQVASYLEKKRENQKARDALVALLKTEISFRDKSIALYWLARLEAKIGNPGAARGYLDKFNDHLLSKEPDKTGYKKIIGNIQKDLIKNDIYLQKL